MIIKSETFLKLTVNISKIMIYSKIYHNIRYVLFVSIFLLIMSLSSTILYFHFSIFEIGDETNYLFLIQQMNNPELIINDWVYTVDFFS